MDFLSKFLFPVCSHHRHSALLCSSHDIFSYKIPYLSSFVFSPVTFPSFCPSSKHILSRHLALFFFIFFFLTGRSQFIRLISYFTGPVSMITQIILTLFVWFPVLFPVLHSLILFTSQLQNITLLHQLFVTVILPRTALDTVLLLSSQFPCLLLSSLSFSCPFFFFFPHSHHWSSWSTQVEWETKYSCPQKLHGKNSTFLSTFPLDRQNIEEPDVNHQQGFADYNYS